MFKILNSSELAHIKGSQQNKKGKRVKTQHTKKKRRKMVKKTNNI